MPYADPEVKKAKQAEYRAANRERLAAAERARQARKLAEDPESWRKRQREQGRKQREARLEHYRAKSRESAKRCYYKKAKDPEFRKKNVQRVAAWVAKNRDKANAAHRRIRRRRVKEDVNYKLGLALRRRLYMAVKGNHRSGTAIQELGCSIEELRRHLEAQFVPGMNWENWSPQGWHIDHIRPLSSFDLTDPDQIKAACHYTNLQPLWAAANQRKHARV